MEYNTGLKTGSIIELRPNKKRKGIKGRPPLPEGEKKERFQLMLTLEERKMLDDHKGRYSNSSFIGFLIREYDRRAKKGEI